VRGHLVRLPAALTALRARGYRCDDITVEISHRASPDRARAKRGVDLAQIRSRVRAHVPSSADRLLDEHGVRRLIVRNPLPDIARIGGRELAGPARLSPAFRRTWSHRSPTSFSTVDFVFDLQHAPRRSTTTSARCSRLPPPTRRRATRVRRRGLHHVGAKVAFRPQGTAVVSGLSLSSSRTRFAPADGDRANDSAPSPSVRPLSLTSQRPGTATTNARPYAGCRRSETNTRSGRPHNAGGRVATRLTTGYRPHRQRTSLGQRQARRWRPLISPGARIAGRRRQTPAADEDEVSACARQLRSRSRIGGKEQRCHRSSRSSTLELCAPGPCPMRASNT
jgi:hypothetical protein